MKEAFMNNKGTVALTPTDAELQQHIVRDALQRGQQHQYVHVDEYQKVSAALREHEEKIREQKERILALEADIAILKDGPPRHRSNSGMFYSRWARCISSSPIISHFAGRPSAKVVTLC